MKNNIVLKSFAVALLEILLMWGFYALADLDYTFKFFLFLFVGFLVLHIIIYSLENKFKNTKHK